MFLEKPQQTLVFFLLSLGTSGDHHHSKLYLLPTHSLYTSRAWLTNLENVR
uniref:Uncharacterized protein n=1 Tax=Helianthus annuus TaxID=4232 RepID=A0A251VQ27_HELAN